jgi:multicomponent Na+:H+ antiporter subunit E
MYRKLGLAVALFALWLLLSGIYQPLLIFFGIISSLLVAWIAHRMDVADHEGFPIHLGVKAASYWPWLVWEIIKSNIDVALIIINPKLQISPTMFNAHASQKTEVGQVTYANSITLTPGTITVGVANGMVEVHALTSATADGVLSGRMDKRVCQMEGDS